MAKKNYGWVFSPPKAKVQTLSNEVKNKLEADLTAIAEKQKAFHHQNEAASIASGCNYCVDVYTEWYRNYFYLVGKYKIGGEISPGMPTEFELKSARITCIDNNTCNLAYFRHTGQFYSVFEGISYEDAIKEIAGNEIYWP